MFGEFMGMSVSYKEADTAPRGDPFQFIITLFNSLIYMGV